MTINGFDYTNHNMSVHTLKANNVKFVCRYLSANPGGWKELTHAEVKRYSDAGIGIVSNWETHGRPNNSVSQGESDARHAWNEAKSLGMPTGRPIYFSIDHDVNPGHMNNYAKGLRNVLGRSRVGLYGPADLIRQLVNDGYIAWGWRTAATGWGGSSTAKCQIVQYHNGVTRGGIDVDLDHGLVNDVGQWRLGVVYGGGAPGGGPYPDPVPTPTPVPTPLPNPTPTPTPGPTTPPVPPVIVVSPVNYNTVDCGHVFIPSPSNIYNIGPYPGHELKLLTKFTSVDFDVATMQHKLNLNGYPLNADGYFGKKTDTAVRAVQKRFNAVVDGIVGPITWALIAGLPK